ncbi:MAG: molybdopterin molybdenumtransferase MoeA, partial [Oscillospiraceae bacterium]|nr:molybdopterin molybdenumtransferase MoeA [Oscillospiraceae bacterium]
MDNYMGLSPEQASERLLRGVSVIPETESVPIEEALGRVAAEAVNAPFPLPPFDRSAMDGYALRAADTLNAAAEKPVALSRALPIGTGGALPEGCDAVAKREDTEMRGDTVFLRRALQSGENVCFAGEDIAQGAPVLEPGRLLGRGD